MMVLRVLIADDEPLFGEALAALLGVDERIEVVGQALDGAEAIELARKLDPDVVLMDLSMPGVNGFGATEQILADDGDAQVLVLSGSDDPADIAKARDAGARGYITKDRIAERLVEAILDAAELP